MSGARAKAYLFDVDGTLVDTNDLHAEAWREAFAQFGHDVALDDVRWQIGKGGDNLIPSLLPDLDQAERDEIEEYRSTLFKRDYMSRGKPFPGVRALFERLRADGAGIVLASSSGEDEVAHYVDLLGVGDLIQAATSRDEAEHSKPCPDIFAAALEKVAPLGPDKVRVVGDSPWDVKAAAKLGLATIGFRCGGFPDEALTEAGAVALYDGPSDMLARYSETEAARG